MIDTRVHDDAVQPGAQLGIVAECAERAVHLDEHVLRDILGIVVISGELQGDSVHHGTMTLDERLKGKGVAARRADYQIRISHQGRSHEIRRGRGPAG
jgi:hypothetical protein